MGISDSPLRNEGVMDMFATWAVWATCGGAVGFIVGNYYVDPAVQAKHRAIFAIYGAILGWLVGIVYLLMP